MTASTLDCAPRPRVLPGWTLRDAVASDADAIARIYNESIGPMPVCAPAAGQGGPLHRWVDSSRLGRFDEAGMALWIKQHQALQRPLWAACADSNVIAWLSFLGLGDRPGMACSSELAVYVSAPWRGVGVGSSLIDAAVRRAPSLGLDRLIAMVWSGNRASLALFRNHGFGLWGMLPDAVWAQGTSHDMMILGRACGHACGSQA
jgi:phosphinothricin acetyltransferase